MSETALLGLSTSTQELLLGPGKRSRRMRPPDLEIKASMEDRPSIRPEKQPKSGRRESRMGFRNFFGRHKVVIEAASAKTPRTTAVSGESELMPETTGSLPGDMQPLGVQSEIHLPPIRDDDKLAPRPMTAALKSPTLVLPSHSPTSTSSRRRTSLATWAPVPLFQAWPQALRSTTLPACIQTDHLLRLQNKKETTNTINHPDLGDDKGIFLELAKKKHRRNSSSFKLDWTTKIYILITSGYLLQYAGEGTHDRLPEKMVHLCKDSAAFASDAIPGRHWVLQVSSVFEETTAVNQDTRSLLGKFGLRDKEKRQVSDILMVFESAADMESWMTFLRREIEVLGGKKSVTETGAPKEDFNDFQWPSLPSASPTQRTLIVRDPSRFGRRPSAPDMQLDTAATFDGPELHSDATLSDLLPEHSFDDNSTTNSFVSQDSQQLDGLRDSSNRYSFMSATKTIVTSDSSACNSPVRDSFGSGSQGSHPSEDVMALSDDISELRLRPNANDIEDRRKSYRTSNIFLDPNTAYVSHRVHSSLTSMQETPNFSLPQAAKRRRASIQTAAEPPIHIAHTASSRPPRRPRRPPPSALGFTRPLSIVADSPSPSRSSPCSPLHTGDSINFSDSQDTTSVFGNWPAEDSRPEYNLSRASSRGSMRTSFQVSVHTSPRKYASMNSLKLADSTLEEEDVPRFDPALRTTIRSASPDGRITSAAMEIPRSISSTGTFPTSPRSRSPIQREMAAQKRASMCSLPGSTGSPRHGPVFVFPQMTTDRAPRSEQPEEFPRGRGVSPAPTPPPRSPYRRSCLSPPHTRTGSDSSKKSFLINRRSLPQMPQLQRESHALLVVPYDAGPPPAPPPTKALPPLPTGKKRAGSIPPRLGMRNSLVVEGGVF